MKCLRVFVSVKQYTNPIFRFGKADYGTGSALQAAAVFPARPDPKARAFGKVRQMEIILAHQTRNLAWFGSSAPIAVSQVPQILKEAAPAAASKNSWLLTSGMEDEIAEVQACRNNVLQEQAVRTVDRDERIVTNLGFAWRGGCRNARELTEIDGVD